LETAADATDDLRSYVDAWEKAFALFEAKDYQSAADQFKALAARNENDNVVRYYLDLLQNFFLKGKYPVAADDVGVEYNEEDGVFKLLQK
jgi:adenylate cyclase